MIRLLTYIGAPFLLLAFQPIHNSTSLPNTGIVLETITKESVLEKAGLQPGDVLHSWQLISTLGDKGESQEGRFASPFDWQWVEIEQAQRGTVQLRGEREAKEISVEIVAGSWGAKVRPILPPSVIDQYEQAKALIEADDIDDGVAVLSRIYNDAPTQSAPHLRCWIMFQVAEIWTTKKQWQLADVAYEKALTGAYDSKSRLFIRDAKAASYSAQRRFEETASERHQMHDEAEATWGQSLTLAWTKELIGEAAIDLEKFDVAQRFLEEAATIEEDLAPNSTSLAFTLNNLGYLALLEGHLKAAEQYHTKALTIRESIQPNSYNAAISMANLGMTLYSRGDLIMAQEHLENALSIMLGIPSARPNLPNVLDALGTIAASKHDYEAAEELFQQSHEVLRQVGAEPQSVAANLVNRGYVLYLQGDFRAAEGMIRQAIEIETRLSPESSDVAAETANLGGLLLRQDRLEEAKAALLKAISLQKTLLPNSLDLAASLKNLSLVYEKLEDMEQAINLQEKCMEIERRQIDGTFDFAGTLSNLGRLHFKTGDLQKAIHYHNLALNNLEFQLSMIARTPEAKVGFRAYTRKMYDDALVAQLELDKEKAFNLLERLRARTLLEMLTERDLIFSDVSPELELERRKLKVKYDQVMAMMLQMGRDTDDKLQEELQLQRMNLRAAQNAVAEKIRKESPSLSTLIYPEPYDLLRTRGTLDDGTIMLSYHASEERLHVFAVYGESDVQCFTIAIPYDYLEEKVRQFLSSMTLNRGSGNSPKAQEFAERAEDMYNILVHPLETLIARSSRVLIVPDGILHQVPFGALRREVGDGTSEYLSEWKPIHTAVSASVYGQLVASRGARGEGVLDAERLEFVAFGDPSYGGGTGNSDQRASLDARVRATLAKSSFSFGALPSSRTEVMGISHLFDEKRQKVYLGDDATEGRVKALSGKEIGILHFATHGYVDADLPLDSGIVLTLPSKNKKGQENGLLQSWEIFEELRIEVDLVMLSACESALGELGGGEGLLSLTRAFHHAGARSVGASLWRVDDEATAELMKYFYRGLRAGQSKDEALQKAQLELIRGPVNVQVHEDMSVKKDFTAPYYWAAFQIYGDWM